MSIKTSIILRIIGKICEHNRGKIMGIAEKNNAQLHWHNGLTPICMEACLPKKILKFLCFEIVSEIVLTSDFYNSY